MSLSQVQPEHYDEQLKQKATQIRERFSEWYQGKLAVHSSPPSHYRMRAEFRIWREHGTLHYAMQDPATRQPVFITHFPVACERINALMVSLMQALQSNPVLQHKLFQVEFHATTTNDALVTLVYHRRLDDLWETAARTLETELDAVVIGRSRGQKVVLSREFVTESFCIDGKTITQQQPESAFSQPNAAINKQMLQWALSQCPQQDSDLLELYCGNGNFTLPLSHRFRNVLATEVSKTSIAAALHNIAENDCHNITVARMASEELTQALQGVRPFRRLAGIDLTRFQFSTVLVDPPRAGLDAATRELVSSMPSILYISCNPDTLHRDIEHLQQTHRVASLAIFDQFPYTHHIECGVLLIAL